MDGVATCDTDLNLEETELRLGLPGGVLSKAQIALAQATKCNKRAADECISISSSRVGSDAERGGEGTPANKVQIVGWPPVRSHWKNSIQARKMEVEVAGIYVKVSMDGAPYLRKIDLKVFNGYTELLKALGDMFICFSIGSEYVHTYEDKDGDWMMVGDVPWNMFITSCKRLRIIKGSDARGSGSGL